MPITATMPTAVEAPVKKVAQTKVRPIVRLCCALMIGTCITMALESDEPS